MRCPVCRNFLPPNSRCCPFCGKEIPLPEPAPQKRSAGLPPAALWIVFGFLLLVALVSCLLLLGRGGLPQPEGAIVQDRLPDGSLSSNVYYIPEADGWEVEAQLQEEETGTSAADSDALDARRAAFLKAMREAALEEELSAAESSASAEMENSPPSGPGGSSGAVFPPENPPAESEPVYTISVSPLQGSIRVGESLDFHVTHNYPDAKVYLSADNFGETSGLYSQSFQWHSLSADFSITALAPGQVLISFFYEDAAHNVIRSEQVSVSILESETPPDPEIQQILDLLQEYNTPESPSPEDGSDPE